MINTLSIMQALETLSYIGLFLWLVLYNLLFFAPLPPYEPVLLSLGYFMYMGYFNPLIAVVVIVCAAVLVDNIFFFFSRKGNTPLEKFINKYNKNIFLKYKKKLEYHYFKSSITLAFIPKFRIFGPIISGSLNVRWRKFFVGNLVANSTTSVVYVSLGYFFHDAIQEFIDKSSLEEHLLVYLIMLVMSILIFFLLKNYILSKNNVVKKTG